MIYLISWRILWQDYVLSVPSWDSWADTFWSSSILVPPRIDNRSCSLKQYQSCCVLPQHDLKSWRVFWQDYVLVLLGLAGAPWVEIVTHFATTWFEAETHSKAVPFLGLNIIWKLCLFPVESSIMWMCDSIICVLPCILWPVLFCRARACTFDFARPSEHPAAKRESKRLMQSSCVSKKSAGKRRAHECRDVLSFFSLGKHSVLTYFENHLPFCTTVWGIHVEVNRGGLTYMFFTCVIRKGRMTWKTQKVLYRERGLCKLVQKFFVQIWWKCTWAHNNRSGCLLGKSER